MIFPFFIANRFSLSRRTSRFISLIGIITVLGISIGVATLILTLTVLEGFEKTVSDKIIQFNSHIQIVAFSDKYLADYNLVRPALVNKLKTHATGISPFVTNLAIIKSRKYTDGVTVKGILNEYDVSELGNNIINGKYDISYSDEEPPIVIGNRLAEKLFVKPGDKVTLFTLKNNQIPSPENPPGIKQFKIAGVFESGMSEYDNQIAYVNLKNAQDIFGMGRNINGYDIKLNNLTKIDSLAENLMDYLGYPYYVRTIFRIYQNIFTWIDLQKRLIPVSLVMIVIVAAFNIVGTLLMIVLERSNAIGILKSLGSKNRQIISIFLIHGMYLAFLGIIIGNLLAYALSILQIKYDLISIPESVYFMSKAPVQINPESYLLVSGVTLLLCIITSVIPSYIATKINPITTLRFN